jgi:SAM-dependent methyltransferase
MLRLAPTRCDTEASQHLAQLLHDPDPSRFTGHIRQLRTRYRSYAATCPVPLAEAGLAVTAEIRLQSNLYLPLYEIRDCFHLLYREALTYPPILSSTPFHGALSWADLYAGLPQRFQLSPDPARLLTALLDDHGLLRDFLFHSFLPCRFYGGFSRYPGQRAYIGEWLERRGGPGREQLRCLDAACGTGEDAYGLAGMLLERDWPREDFQVSGWTVEPLEVWSAACGSFPHDRRRTETFRCKTGFVFEQGAQGSMEFRCIDLLSDRAAGDGGLFDLILCNGLLGGPILHELRQQGYVLSRLAGLLAPGGVLMTADSFHGGWKRKRPQQELRAFFEKNGLQIVEAGEGFSVIAPQAG